jgi:xanthine permease XanP
MAMKDQASVWKIPKGRAQISQKPSGILFGVDERPPLGAIIFLGLQHVSLFFISLIFPVVIISLLGSSIDPESARAYISLSFISAAISTMMQALKKGPVGSGYLCPTVCGPSYMDASKAAAALGGLPLILGMTAVAGIIEVFISRIIHRLRVLFPAEVTGVAVTMVGITIVPLSVRNLLVVHEGNVMGSPTEIMIGLVTLAAIVGFNVFSKGSLKLYCSLLGMTIGYLLAWMTGIIPAADVARITSAPFFELPYIRGLSWSLNISLLIPFTVAVICSTLKAIGDLVMCQKINDAQWKTPEMNSISRGLFADGLGVLVPSAIGGFGQSTSSSNIGLSMATGVTSRVVAFAMGGVLILLAFLPQVSTIFLIMPKPVMGAALIFAASFMIVSGLQIITSRMMDARKIIVVGISIIMGLSVDMIPGLYSHMHPWIAPVFKSSLALATILALVLNLVMRIGIAKKRQLELYAIAENRQKLHDFIEETGKSWGALAVVMEKVKSAVLEFNEALMMAGITNTPVRYELRFDELSIAVNIYYSGPLLSLSHAGSVDWIHADDAAYAKVAMSLIYYQTDHVHVTQHQGMNHYTLQFDH